MIRLFLLLSSACFGQTWAAISPGGTVPFANGFYNKLLWDSTNNEMLYYGHPQGVSSIYSSAIYGYSTQTHNFTLRVNNGATTENCAQQGAPYNAFNPLNGHPQGFFWYDSTHNQAQGTNQLCMNQFMGLTFFYRSATHDMGTALAKGPFGTGDGGFNATGVNYQNVDWISGYGKALYCCSNGQSTVVKIIEFNGVDTWTDVSGSVTGTLPGAGLITATATMSDGTNLWVLGGCIASSPGNFSPNNCASKTAELFKYVPTTKVFSQMSPVGGVKPPTTNSSWPFAYYDSRRSWIIWYAGTNDLWAYSISTNTWTEFTTTGGFAIPTMGSIGADGNMAQYDPVNDVGVFIYPVNGGGAIPLVYQLTWSGGSVTSITSSGSVVIH